MEKKYELMFMTWKEADEAFKQNPVVILPLGSMEVHGPHSPVGDFLVADEVAKKTAEKSGAYTLPVVPFGHSEYFRAFPGTISVMPETLYHLVDDICTSLLEHGVTKIMFLNGHAGNGPALEQLARRIRRERGLIITRMDMWQMLPPEVMKEVYGENLNKIGHGGGPVDTVMKYLHPDKMRMDLYDKGEVRRTKWQEFPMAGLGKTKVYGSATFLPVNMEDISPQGNLGDPLLGDSAGGEKLLNWMVDCCCVCCRD